MPTSNGTATEVEFVGRDEYRTAMEVELVGGSSRCQEGHWHGWEQECGFGWRRSKHNLINSIQSQLL